MLQILLRKLPRWAQQGPKGEQHLNARKLLLFTCDIGLERAGGETEQRLLGTFNLAQKQPNECCDRIGCRPRPPYSVPQACCSAPVYCSPKVYPSSWAISTFLNLWPRPLTSHLQPLRAIATGYRRSAEHSVPASGLHYPLAKMER